MQGFQIYEAQDSENNISFLSISAHRINYLQLFNFQIKYRFNF